MTERDRIRYLSKGDVIEVSNFDPMRTLLDHLRLDRARTGTKEGCNEGDCGACTVALGRLRDGRVVYEPVNACIQLLGQVDGAEVVTVEDLATSEGLHPIQSAMIELHGSQCGFCTPGIVMSLYTLYQSDSPADRADIVDQLAGNLCRCTGYRPIVEAALTACGNRSDTPSDDSDTAAKLAALADPGDLFIGDQARFFAAPASVASLAALYQAHSDAVILAGGTDVGLWITKQMRQLPKIIHIGRVAGLDRVTDLGDRLEIGATATFAALYAAMAAIDPDLGEIWRRIGSRQVRASGTLGGNIANGSPIGDSPPALIALDAAITLQSGEATRTLALEDFFIAYGKQDRAAGEFLRSISVPKLKPDMAFRAYKISKRFDQDISAVMAAFRLTLDGERIVAARLAYGGMAATPKRASAAEAALAGASLTDPVTWQAALAAIGDDFAPLSDMRASAQYRRETAAALLEKALIEIAGADVRETRVIGHRPLAAAE